MRIFFSVGEPSGDLHGSNLIRHLKQSDPDIEFVGFGGPKMQAQGCELIYDLTQMAVMFLGKVIANLRFFFGLVDQADDYFAAYDVDAVVLIDYPGFNWWIARKAKARGIPVYYYGVPQMWAWAPWRVRKIRKYVDHVLCKLPFEQQWFSDRNCTANYVGHPYFDQLANQTFDSSFIEKLRQDLGLADRKLILLLPGSRDQEVENNLPTLIESAELVAQQCPKAVFAIGCYKDSHVAVASEMLDRLSGSRAEVKVFAERTPELMKSSAACIACSGSVSLELLFHRKPTVIVYRVKRWMMVLQSIVLQTQYITLTNLIEATDIKKKTWRPADPETDDMVMPEHMSVASPAPKVASQIYQWLGCEASRQSNIRRLDDLAKKYAKPGATKLAAEYLLATLGKNKSRQRNVA